MNSAFSNSAKSLLPEMSLPLDSPQNMEWAVRIILGIVFVGSGLVAIAPYVQRSEATYLPPVTATERDYYTQQIQLTYQRLASPTHTSTDHLYLADTLANIGEREAATQAYLRSMSHDSHPHTH